MLRFRDYFLDDRDCDFFRRGESYDSSNNDSRYETNLVVEVSEESSEEYRGVYSVDDCFREIRPLRFHSERFIVIVESGVYHGETDSSRDEFPEVFFDEDDEEWFVHKIIEWMNWEQGAFHLTDYREYPLPTFHG